MPTFTIELFRAIELAPNGDIGLNDYPIFDPAYREPLNQKIIAHYHSREIGMETIGKFTFAMKRRMNEIMPYYNDLYKSQRMEFDPLATMDIRTITTGESQVESEGHSESVNNANTESGSRAVQSTTPQAMLSGSGDYASSAADTTSKGTSAGSGNENSESATTEQNNAESHVTGYQGSGASLIMEYRRSLMNVDMLVIDELSDLFMGVWDNGDDFTPYPYTNLPML